jgi:hypothetical protein
MGLKEMFAMQLILWDIFWVKGSFGVINKFNSVLARILK